MKNSPVEIGTRFGHLTVISNRVSVSGKWKYLCRCDCGVERSVEANHLRSGKTKSCGCLRKSLNKELHLTHGHCANGKISKENTIWTGMKQRCLNPKNSRFAGYGGRGITVCPEWVDSFETFLADMGPCPEGHSLERKDNDGPYSKDNCEWVPKAAQARNKRTTVKIMFEGQLTPLRTVAEKLGVSFPMLYQRIHKYGWSLEDALNPIRAKPGPKPTGEHFATDCKET